MKQEDWTQRLRDQLADYEEAAPEGLWADIEARLEATMAPAPEVSASKASKQKARLLPLWGKRVAVAAAFIGMMTCNGYLMWEISKREEAAKIESQVLADNSPKLTPNSQKLSAESSNSSEFTQDSPEFTSAPRKAYQEASEIHTSSLEIHSNSPEDVKEVLNPEEKKPIPSVKTEKSPQKTLPTEQEQLRQLDAKIAEATKARQHRRIGFGLYAQNGFGSETSANGVLMSPQLAANYDYSQYLMAHRTRAANQEPIYLVNYEERQKHYQPISFGLTTNIPVSSRLSLTTGLVYTRLRSDFVVVMAGYPMTTEQTLHYIGVPLSAQYRLWGYKGLKVYASAGGQADYNVKARDEMNGITQDIRRDRWQFSVQGAVGVEYDIIPQLGIYVEPGVKHYFDNGSKVHNYFKDKPTGLNLQVGLRLNLGDQK